MFEKQSWHCILRKSKISVFFFIMVMAGKGIQMMSSLLCGMVLKMSYN